MKIRRLLIASISGLGLALALLWTLGYGPSPTAHASGSLPVETTGVDGDSYITATRPFAAI